MEWTSWMLLASASGIHFGSESHLKHDSKGKQEYAISKSKRVVHSLFFLMVTDLLKAEYTEINI